MKNLESFTKWRTKIIIIILVLFFMLLGFVKSVRAATWPEVLAAYDGYSPPDGGSKWVQKVSVGGIDTYRLWYRPFQLHSESCYIACCANGLVDQIDYRYCTDIIAQAPFATSYAPCLGTETICPWDTCGTYPTICGANDVMINSWTALSNNCGYSGGLVSGGTDHPGQFALNLPLGTSGTACLPDGTRLQGCLDNWLATTAGGQIGTGTACYYEAVVGDPAGPSNPSAENIPAVGVGTSPVVPPPPPPPPPPPSPVTSDGGITGTSDIGDITTVTGALTGGTGVTGDGLVGSGISTGATLTGTFSGPTGTGTYSRLLTFPTLSTAGFNESLIAGSGYVTSGGSPCGDRGDFGSLFTCFTNDIKATAFFQRFNLTQAIPTGTGSPSINMSTTTYGTIAIDFSTPWMASGLAILRGFILIIGGLIAIRIVVLKR